MATPFVCERCGYVGGNKQCLVRHLQRKKLCPPEHSNVPTEQLLHKILVPWSETGNNIKCTFCNRPFQARSNMYRHQKVCKKRPFGSSTEGELREELDKMQEEIRQLKSCQTHTQNQTNIQNQNNIQTQNILVVNAFGKEDMSHLTDAFKSQCIRRTDKGFVELLEKIHFDPSKPENKNLQISNIKLPFIRTFDGNRWTYQEKDDILNNLMEKGQTILSEHYDEHEDVIKQNLSNSMVEHIHTWMELIEIKDKDAQEKLLRKIYLLILNSD